MGCRECTFWNADDVPYEINKHHGLCSKAIFIAESDDSNPMITNDASYYEAELYTRWDHSCKEEKNE